MFASPQPFFAFSSAPARRAIKQNRVLLAKISVRDHLNMSNNQVAIFDGSLSSRGGVDQIISFAAREAPSVGRQIKFFHSDIFQRASEPPSWTKHGQVYCT